MKSEAQRMPCETCGNQYAHSFEIRYEGETYFFDSFECAIQRLAPRCTNCGVAIVGHGVESDDQVYCCAHCSRAAGVKGLRDHAERPGGAPAEH
jgi:hypothetical protein